MFISYFRLEIITIPNHLGGVVGEAVFYGLRNIKSLILPKGVVTINSNALQYLTTKTLVLPPSLSTWSSAFYRVSDVIIPPKVTSVGTIFYEKQDFIKMPLPVTNLSANAFRSSFALVFIFGANIKSIGGDCFYNAKQVKMYDFRKTMQVPTLGNSTAFSGIANNCKIVVPDNLYDNWVIATNWSTYSSYIIKASEYVE